MHTQAKALVPELLQMTIKVRVRDPFAVVVALCAIISLTFQAWRSDLRDSFQL